MAVFATAPRVRRGTTAILGNRYYILLLRHRTFVVDLVDVAAVVGVVPVVVQYFTTYTLE